MIERIFLGWHHPVLAAAVGVIAEHAPAHASDTLLVVPGRRAGRCLAELLAASAFASDHPIIRREQIITPGELPERLYTPTRPLASPLAARFAWAQAADRLHAQAGLSEEAMRVRDVVATEGLTLAKAVDQARDNGLTLDSRWPLLVQIEQTYNEILAEAGLIDRDDARRTALEHGAVNWHGSVYVIGAQDLNGVERALLRTLPGQDYALIPAPETLCDGFDDVGVLVPAFWSNQPIPISDDILQFVSAPADEANAAADQIVQWRATYAPHEITVGTGNVHAGEGLARRLGVAGNPVSSPLGPPLLHTRPGALLRVLSDYLRTDGAREFAALIRHPDMEAWLETEIPPAAVVQDASADTPNKPHKMAIAPLLCCIDALYADTLPERLSAVSLQSPQRHLSSIEIARERVSAARDRLSKLVGEDWNASLALDSWSRRVGSLLAAIYRDTQSQDNDDRLSQSLEAFRSVIDSLADIPQSLSPLILGLDTLELILAEASRRRLSGDNDPARIAQLGWLELALDDAPALLLTGLHEGDVPQSGIGDDSLLPDALRQRLGLADDGRRHARDSFLLRVILESRPSVRIVQTRRGADGDPLMPSRLLFACDGETAARRVLKLAENQAAARRPLFAAGRERHLAPPPVMPTPKIERLSVTAFRDYLACPYRFYLKHVCELEAVQVMPEEMDRRLFGTLLHAALDAFARSRDAESLDAERVSDALLRALDRVAERRFGMHLSPAVLIQIRQARRRLKAFAAWQAQSVRDGWQIQPDLTERELSAALIVDDEPFVILGRLDRVDYHAGLDRFRIIDYKTGDKAHSPDAKHRGPGASRTDLQWTDLQLPLYRQLLAGQGHREEDIETGYVVLSSDLAAISLSARGRASGGSGFLEATWSDGDYDAAGECAADVVRKLRAGVFWPPSEPPAFADDFSAICLDSSPDRATWLASRTTLDAVSAEKLVDAPR